MGIQNELPSHITPTPNFFSIHWLRHLSSLSSFIFPFNNHFVPLCPSHFPVSSHAIIHSTSIWTTTTTIFCCSLWGGTLFLCGCFSPVSLHTQNNPQPCKSSWKFDFLLFWLHFHSFHPYISTLVINFPFSMECGNIMPKAWGFFCLFLCFFVFSFFF